MKLSGIYRIKNIITGDCYVGSSVNIEKRWKSHRNDLKANRHNNRIIQNSYNKYGVDAFKYEIFEICPEEYLLEREQERIDSGTFKYNICLDAKAPMAGRKHSEESIEKMRAASKGNTYGKGKAFSAEHKANLRAAASKKSKPSAESIAKRAAANKGAVRSDETKAKISAARKAWHLRKVVEELRNDLKELTKVILQK